MTLLQALPKDSDGEIVLNPAGMTSDGKVLVGAVDATAFANNFDALAGASVPLSDADFAALKAIDEFWSANADTWRAAGLI